MVYILYTTLALWSYNKGGVEGPAGPAIAVPLFLAMRNAGALFCCIIESRPYIIDLLCAKLWRTRKTFSNLPDHFPNLCAAHVAYALTCTQLL